MCNRQECKSQYSCPCCGYKTLNAKPPGTYLICPICFWEDNGQALGWEDNWGGSNQVTLRQAQRNFIEFGACEQKWVNDVRPPTTDDLRDLNWQTIDNIAEKSRSILILQITKAFENVTLEDGISLHQARALDDYADPNLARKIDESVRWQDIPSQWIKTFHDVFPFLDPKGFRYYIPAYMIWCLQHYEHPDSNTFDYTIYVLKQVGKECYYSSRFELLNSDQLQTISDFLRFMNMYAYA